MENQNNENSVRFSRIVPDANSRSALTEKLRKCRLEHLYKKAFYRNTNEKSRPLYVTFDKRIFDEIYLGLYKYHINPQLRCHNFKLLRSTQTLKLIFGYFGEEPPCV